MYLRIHTIAEMVGKGLYVADIGTDHALLPIYLLKNGISNRACACDVVTGPLKIAEKNIREHGLSDKITVLRSDGFENVPVEVESAVIAGMGYYTCCGILEKGVDRMKNLKELILQVNGQEDVILLRRWISAKEWTIDEERYVHENGKDYVILRVLPVRHLPYSEEEMVLGPCLLRAKDKDYLECTQRWASHLEQIMKCRSQNDAKQKEMEHLRNLYLSMKDLYDRY